jgi:uncharacterized protein (TIGR02246 family)
MATTMSAQTPEECDRLFGEHVNAGDLEGLLALYEPGCSLVRRDGGVARGHAEIRAVLSRLLTMRARMSTEIVKVVRAGDELALVYNDWRMSAERADGQPVEATGKAIEVVRRQMDGTWRFILDDPFARG